eukprot:CAMPEP_0117574590 /NCGR_PEP_ID=MMETSP0784-20121206/61683_1 /TAXON_ID=39447 /ORGANISM="" /LENGTH=200 /DNA_ID=CAMNT_0005373461 /DNA_START=196 /DNA_END=799 /DNA_ORIENTATION=-
MRPARLASAPRGFHANAIVAARARVHTVVAAQEFRIAALHAQRWAAARSAMRLAGLACATCGTSAAAEEPRGTCVDAAAATQELELRHSTQNVELLHDPQWAWQAWQIRPVAPTPSLKYPRGQTSTQSPLLRSFESRHSRQSVGLLQDPQCASQICFRMQITCHVSVRDCTAVMSTAWLESNSHPAGASEMFRPKIKHFE